MKHNSDVPGQLALFAIPATAETRAIVHDPYWDEILAPEHPGTKLGVNVGDLVKLSPDWMDKCAAATTGKFKKDYQYKSDKQLISPVIWVDPLGKGHIYVDRGNNEALFVPSGCYTVENVRAQVSEVTNKVAPEQNTHWVEKYWVERSGYKYWYFRYCWMTGRKKNRIHLGSVDSIIAKRKKADVEIAIADGKLPLEIEQLIRSWRGTKSDK